MITTDELSQYFPFNKLNAEFYPLLLTACTFFSRQKGDILSRINEAATDTLYLTKGEVHILTQSGREKNIKAKNISAKYPLADAQNSQNLAIEVSSTKAEGFTIDSKLLAHFQVWNRCHEQAALDSPLRNHSDYHWVLGLLTSRTVQMLPQGNVDELFAVLERLEVNKGDTLMTEGEAGDYGYIIATGQAGVFKCQAEGEQQVAELQRGDLFGESALVAHEPRSASVHMLTSGVLMRLAGEQFRKLLKSHVVRWITAEHAIKQIADGATLLDVREAPENKQLSIEGSLHMPLAELRRRSNQLNPEHPVITCSNMGSRCAAAAFTLATMGFDVYALQGGISGLARYIDRP